MSKQVKGMLIGIGIIIFVIIIDQITKGLAISYLKEGNKSVKIIDGFFHLTYVENSGGAWGMFAGRMWGFIVVTLVALAIFAYLMKFFDLKERTIFSIALILMISGTLGNFIDRIFRGYVVDFLDFYIFGYNGYNFPVFNFADICLTIGTSLLIFDILFGKSSHFLK